MNSLGIPTAVSEVEAFTLAQLATAKDVLEVGSLLGFSTVTMAFVANSVVSIDPHEGYPLDNPRPTYPAFIANLERFGVEAVVDAYKDFDSVLVGDFQGGPFDFAFIDATGEYADTIRIMERVTDHLVADNALMAVHDYGTMPWPGVGEAVRDYCTQRNLNFGIVDTLAIVRVGHPDD